MLNVTPRKGSTIFYVVDDFDDCGIYTIKVQDVERTSLTGVGLDKGLKDSVLMFDTNEYSLFSSYSEAKMFLNNSRFYY